MRIQTRQDAMYSAFWEGIQNLVNTTCGEYEVRLDLRGWGKGIRILVWLKSEKGCMNGRCLVKVEAISRVISAFSSDMHGDVIRCSNDSSSSWKEILAFEIFHPEGSKWTFVL